MRYFVLLFLLVVSSSFAVASQEGRENTAAVVLLVADWVQTRNMAYNHDYQGELVYHENNPLLGEQPTKAGVDQYFLWSLGLYVALQKVLPDDWATVHRRLTITVEGGCVLNNWYIVYRYHNKN